MKSLRSVYVPPGQWTEKDVGEQGKALRQWSEDKPAVQPADKDRERCY